MMAQYPFLKASKFPHARGTNHAAAPLLAHFEAMLEKSLIVATNPRVDIGRNKGHEGLQIMVYDPKYGQWTQYFYPFTKKIVMQGNEKKAHRSVVIPQIAKQPAVISIRAHTALMAHIAAHIDTEMYSFYQRVNRVQKANLAF